MNIVPFGTVIEERFDLKSSDDWLSELDMALEALRKIDAWCPNIIRMLEREVKATKRDVEMYEENPEINQ